MRASDNAQSGIWAQVVKASNVQASRNGANGVTANDWLRVRTLDATANGGWGVSGGFSLSHSSIRA